METLTIDNVFYVTGKGEVATIKSYVGTWMIGDKVLDEEGRQFTIVGIESSSGIGLHKHIAVIFRGNTSVKPGSVLTKTTF